MKVEVAICTGILYDLFMIKRDIEEKLMRLSKKYPVLTITGPRQSGKTTLCKKIFKNKKYVSLEELDNRDFAMNDPRGFLKQFGNNVIIDEIQRVPHLLSYIQSIVDEKKNSGFVLTGSAQFELMNEISQSLAGRSLVVKLLPFSLKEVKRKYKKRIDPFEIIIKGFYPRVYDKNLDPSSFYSSYVSTYIERDLRMLINIKDLSVFQKFLKICAGRTGNVLNLISISNDIGVSHTTVKKWISILEASYIIFLLPPYFANINKRIIKSPKLYFYDVGLASYLLGIENKKQVIRDPMRGFLFENLVISEFIKYRYNNLKSSNLYFYRDSHNIEVDLIYENGSELSPVEIKSGETISSDYFYNLKEFKKIFSKKVRSLALVYAGEKNQFRTDTDIFSFNSLNSLIDRL